MYAYPTNEERALSQFMKSIELTLSLCILIAVVEDTVVLSVKKYVLPGSAGAVAPLNIHLDEFDPSFPVAPDVPDDPDVPLAPLYTHEIVYVLLFVNVPLDASTAENSTSKYVV